MTIEIEHAQQQFEALMARVAAGEEILLLQNGVGFARITPRRATENDENAPRVASLHRGNFWVSDDFDDPLPESFWLGEDTDEDAQQDLAA